jgi:hypothetical protein
MIRIIALILTLGTLTACAGTASLPEDFNPNFEF